MDKATNTASPSQKTLAQRMISDLPDDTTYDDIQYHLYVLEKIRRGEADIAAGRVHTHEEARKRFAQWLA